MPARSSGTARSWRAQAARSGEKLVASRALIVLGLPVAAIQLVGDSNRMLDNAPSLRVHVPVLRCEVREHRGKRTTAQSYNLLLARTRSVEPRLPAEIQVSRQLCEAAGDSADFEIGPGRWGIPWYRKIRVGDLVVESPMAGAW